VAINTFIPEFWSAALLQAIRQTNIFGGFVNRDYEGEFGQAGDTVHVNTVGRPTIRTYTPHTSITVDPLTDSETTITITQSKYWAFEVDDIEKRQALNAGALVNTAMTEAGAVLSETLDSYVAGLMTTDALAGNKLGATTVNSADTAFNLLVALRTKLSNNRIPAAGRWAAVSSDFVGYMLKDARFNNASAAGTTEALRNGFVGRAVGFDLYEVPAAQLPAGASTGKIFLAGHPMATTLAEQIRKTEGLRMVDRFADMARGLHLYGAKTLRPAALATADVTVS
jgi:hypothetical protein